MTNYPNSLILPLRDSEWLISAVSEVTNVDRATVRKRLRQEHQRFLSAVPQAFFSENLVLNGYNERLCEFYEKTDAFLYEITTWNRTSHKCKMRDYIVRCLHKRGIRSGKILMCGDGIGADSFFFAQQGYEVTSFDVSRHEVLFAKKMFEEYHMDVTIVDSLDALPKESFDVILCLDVLEHLPDPVDAVRNSTKLLRAGGYFIFSSPFYLIGKNWPTHLDSNRKYSGQVRVWEDAGDMKQVDGTFLQYPILFQKRGGEPIPRMSLGKRLFTWYGSGWLKIFGRLPRLMPSIITRVLRSDRQLLQLMPAEDFKK